MCLSVDVYWSVNVLQACMARGRLRQASYYSSMAVAKLEALFNMMQEEDFATAASLYTIVLRMKLASGELYEALDNGERTRRSSAQLTSVVRL